MNLPLHGKGDFCWWKFRNFRWGDYLGWSKWVQYNHKCLYKGKREAGGSEWEKELWWLKQRLEWYALTMEQGTTSQGMQVDCGSSEEQGSRFLRRTSRRNSATPIFYWHSCPPGVTASQVVLVVNNPPANAGDIRDGVPSWLQSSQMMYLCCLKPRSVGICYHSNRKPTQRSCDQQLNPHSLG